MGDWRDLNPQHSPPQGDALPLSYSHQLVTTDPNRNILSYTIDMRTGESKKKNPVILIMKLCILIGLATTALAVAAFAKKTLTQKKTSKVLGAEVGKNVVKPAEELINTMKKTADDLVDLATKTTNDTISQSTKSVSDYVYDNTVGNLLKQFNKLPQNQQDDIRRNICQWPIYAKATMGKQNHWVIAFWTYFCYLYVHGNQISWSFGLLP